MWTCFLRRDPSKTAQAYPTPRPRGRSARVDVGGDAGGGYEGNGRSRFRTSAASGGAKTAVTSTKEGGQNSRPEAERPTGRRGGLALRLSPAFAQPPLNAICVIARNRSATAVSHGSSGPKGPHRELRTKRPSGGSRRRGLAGPRLTKRTWSSSIRFGRPDVAQDLLFYYRRFNTAPSSPPILPIASPTPAHTAAPLSGHATPKRSQRFSRWPPQ